MMWLFRTPNSISEQLSPALQTMYDDHQGKYVVKIWPKGEDPATSPRIMIMNDASHTGPGFFVVTTETPHPIFGYDAVGTGLGRGGGRHYSVSHTDTYPMMNI